VVDVGMADVDIRTTTLEGIGALAGRMEDGSCLANVHADGLVEASGVSPYYGYAGGLVGSAWNAAIDQSSFVGVVNAPGYAAAGGIVGDFSGWVQLALSNSFANGTVVGGANTGGLAGATVYDMAVRDSYFRGAVSGTGRVGGLVGYLYAKITGCYAAGTVSGAAGLTGRLAGDGTSSVGSYIAHSYAVGSTGSLFGRGDFARIDVGYGSLADIYDWVIASWNDLWVKDPLKATDPLLRN
jgi:hypothetical protein